ncbi:MAG: helix-turn-helix domain-containing protein [Candidatus Omnitrophota bacterium]|nr:helix-turn-helix domain-containing protein [Candidatus Omnitrophota bacterium]
MESISIVEIGVRLKEAREKRSLTIDQAQKQTRIHSKVLIALEEGKCDDMLNTTYVKSFLKKYSSYLGLDSVDILKGYLALHSGPAAQGAAAMKKEAAKDSAGTPVLGHRPEAAAGTANFTKFIFAAMSLFLITALLFLGFLLWKKTIGSMAKPKFVRAVRESHVSNGIKTARASYQKKPQAAAAVSKQKKSLKIADLKLKEVSRSEGAKQEPVARASYSKNTSFNLAIKVKEPVLIQLKKDGVLLFKRVLSKGDMESYRVNEVINIYVAKAEAIELVLNGRVLNVPARGIVRNLEVKRNGITIK